MLRDRFGFGNPVPFGISFGYIETVDLIFGRALLTQHCFFAAIDDEVPASIVRTFAGDSRIQVRVLRQHANAGLQHDWKFSNVDSWE